MTDTPPRRGPVLIEEGAPELSAPAPSPAEAPPPPDADAPAPALAGALRAAAAPPRRSLAARAFWWAAGGFVSLAVSVTAWDFAAGLLARSPALGWLAAALAAVAVLALLVIAAREAAGLARMRKVDALRDAAARALRENDRKGAEAVLDGMSDLHAGRPDLDWARARVAERRGELTDADALLALAEREQLAPLDAEARRAVEDAARKVAAFTALAPVALVDVAAALALNVRMIRRVAEVYGGRAGALGSWRLLRAVAGHLVATGAVAVGDDVLGPVLGGGALAKLSRRFGEGVVNGALTARVGAAAIEVCRPMPFVALRRPGARSLAAGALGGLFSKGEG